ncbi:MAG: DUF177 domain-containing protein [Candidatus Glassbacteria bacterium]
MSVLIIELDAFKSGSYRSLGSLMPVELEIGENEAFEFAGPLELDIRISTTDNLTFYASGTLSYQAEGECRKCLKAIKTPTRSAVHGVYAFPEALQKLSVDRDTTDSGDIYQLDRGRKTIDLTELIRECLVLEYPIYIQCSENCRGLCPDCGADLNVKDCGCRSGSADVRWTKLLELKEKK